jgi:glucosamine--fructose-6-phosphate aminotransferase (isomerizing)
MSSDPIDLNVETLDGPGRLMRAEVAEQPQVLAGLLAAPGQIVAARERIAATAPRFVLIAARGTSDHAALYAKYLIEVRMQLPVGLVSPSALTVYGSQPQMQDVLFIAVSQSGGSPDLIESLRIARRQGALTLAVTNASDSELSAAAEISVDVQAGVERAVAATKTYTAELMALALLFGGDDVVHDAGALPRAAERTLELASDERLAAVASSLAPAERLVVTARGFSYPTAREAALKLMETSYVSAQAFSGADLLHGPLAMVDAHLPVIAIASPGLGGDALTPVLERLAERETFVLRVGDEHLLSGGADPGRTLPIAAGELPEYLLPILEILPLQRLAWHLALERGVDPDRPRGLAKVTQTL